MRSKEVAVRSRDGRAATTTPEVELAARILEVERDDEAVRILEAVFRRNLADLVLAASRYLAVRGYSGREQSRSP